MDTFIAPVVVPYAGNIPGGVKQGVEIDIQGTLPHHSGGGFSVNISQGPTIEPNTLLHFNVRPNQNCVVLNTLHNNSWGSEDRKPQRFNKGKPFELHIKVQPEMFKITVNGSHFADFPHRLPKDMGQFLVIHGEVSINFIRYRSQGGPAGGCAPPPYEAGFVYPPSGGYPVGGCYPSAVPPGGALYNPPVPFKTPIPGGLVTGRMISISGVPHSNPSRFTVNLQSGYGNGGNIMMHLDVRFRFSDGSVNTVVRNHCQGGGWGQEERGLGYFPFMPNASFDILILTEPNAFKVAVNNQHMLEFRHRLPYQQADVLSVTGDVRLTQVRFQ